MRGVVLIAGAHPTMRAHPGSHLLGFVRAPGVVVGAAGAAGAPVVDAPLVLGVLTAKADADGAGHTPPPSLRDLVARIAPRPVFLIYAENGGGGEELTPQYYAAAAQPKQQWLVPGAGHTGGLATHPEEYEQRVIEFFDRGLLGR